MLIKAFWELIYDSINYTRGLRSDLDPRVASGTSGFVVDPRREPAFPELGFFHQTRKDSRFSITAESEGHGVLMLIHQFLIWGKKRRKERVVSLLTSPYSTIYLEFPTNCEIWDRRAGIKGQ